MKRRNSMDDNSSSSWSICQYYYYTHNNESSDHVSLKYSVKSELQQEPLSSRSLSQKRRRSYPLAIVDLQRSLQRTATFPTSSRQKGIKRRLTLSDLSSQKNDHNLNVISANRTDNILMGDNNGHDDERWDIIPYYLPQLDNEKVQEEEGGGGLCEKQQDSKDEIHSYEPTHISNKLIKTKEIHSQQQQQQLRVVNNTDDDNNSHRHTINSPIIEDLISSSTHMLSDHLEAGTIDDRQEKDNDLHPHMDIALFLFGFLFFPLWWIGAWRYLRKKTMNITKQDHLFCMLNCYMTMVSLIITGLIIGLVTAWA
ncbi:uncharacterized protein BX663DRAFT_493758 [Cokeromyces recurvatus]|uniref:uncharacterized protein n=1 Tax=Cokeromyces recurvatus TaxID=90255 RepID=UPI0022207EA9|nr:uncharacterized protein BX663DRAFT_493758 [Cokeromyces recurvatus]KAI7908307.1 hypothetical protein BX663DRAFT_493758 [Cokeromyces recurvatus]